MNDPHTKPDYCRALVLFPNWLGDAVMATGLLEILDRHRTLPDGRLLHLTLGIRRAWAPIFQDDPRCDDLLIIERRERHAGVSGLFRLKADLTSGRFEAVVLGPPSLRVALAASLARIPIRVGFAGDGRRFLLSPSLPGHVRGEMHYCQEMRELGSVLLKQLGVPFPSNDVPLQSYLPGCDKVVAAPNEAGCPRWILAPGATYGLAKTWPLARAQEFSRLAVGQEGVELILLGDAGSGTFAGDLARGLNLNPSASPTGKPGLVNLTGRTSMLEVVSLLKSSAAFVGNDSGLMHLAAALGVPTLGVFGSSNPAWTAPQGRCARALVAEGFDCQPCYRKTCNQPHFCLDTVDGEQVLMELKNLLDGCPAPPGDLS